MTTLDWYAPPEKRISLKDTRGDIVKILHRDRESTPKKIGEELGVATNRTWQRLKALEKLGTVEVVNGYNASLSRASNDRVQKIFRLAPGITPDNAKLF